MSDAVLGIVRAGLKTRLGPGMLTIEFLEFDMQQCQRGYREQTGLNAAHKCSVVFTAVPTRLLYSEVPFFRHLPSLPLPNHQQ